MERITTLAEDLKALGLITDEEAEKLEEDVLIENLNDDEYDDDLPEDVDVIEVDDDEDDEPIDEVAGKWKIVVRKGKKVRKYVCPKGYKVVRKNGRPSGCVKLTSKEKMALSKRAKKAAKKSKSKRIRNLKKSLKIRKRIAAGVDFNDADEVNALLNDISEVFSELFDFEPAIYECETAKDVQPALSDFYYELIEHIDNKELEEKILEAIYELENKELSEEELQTAVEALAKAVEIFEGTDEAEDIDEQDDSVMSADEIVSKMLEADYDPESIVQFLIDVFDMDEEEAQALVDNYLS